MIGRDLPPATPEVVAALAADLDAERNRHQATILLLEAERDAHEATRRDLLQASFDRATIAVTGRSCPAIGAEDLEAVATLAQRLKSSIDENARLTVDRDVACSEVDRLRRDFVALRRALWARLDERQATVAAIHALLATEPAVSKARCGEIEALIVDALNEPTGKRPPYGDTSGRIDVEMARAMLENLEHEDVSRDAQDSLFVELRMACNEIDQLCASVRASALTLDAARQLHAMRAELERIVGGTSPAPDLASRIRALLSADPPLHAEALRRELGELVGAQKEVSHG